MARFTLLLHLLGAFLPGNFFCKCLKRTHVSRDQDIRLLPSLVPENVRNDTALAIKSELETRITRLKEMIDAGVIEQSKSNGE